MQIQVDYVEKDTRITLKLGNDLNRRDVTGGLANQQHVANWGLARISHKQWRESSDYFYDDTAGNGVRVYVVDSGIRCTHQEFQPGRAVWGTNLVAGSPDTDEFGHGTHVAGTVGGATYGVAKKATLVAIKVLDINGEGAIGQLLAGIDFAIRDAEALGVANSSVINISLGAKLDPSINEAVDVAVNVHGMTVAVAAGNDHEDSTNYSPASAPSVLTVGAIVGTSFPSAFTNFGPIVDIYAPGVSILSAGIENDNATRYLSGTSQGGFNIGTIWLSMRGLTFNYMYAAAPHVAGLAAYFIAKEGLSGAAVAQRVINAAVPTTAPEGPIQNYLIAYNDSGK